MCNTLTVNTLFRRFEALIKNGHGEVPVYVRDHNGDFNPANYISLDSMETPNDSVSLDSSPEEV